MTITDMNIIRNTTMTRAAKSIKQQQENPSPTKWPEWLKQKILGVETVCVHGINSRGVEKRIVATWHHISHLRVTKVQCLRTQTLWKPLVTSMPSFLRQKRNALIREEEDLVRKRKVVEILLDITKTLGLRGIAFRGHGDDKKGNFY